MKLGSANYFDSLYSILYLLVDAHRYVNYSTDPAPQGGEVRLSKRPGMSNQVYQITVGACADSETSWKSYALSIYPRLDYAFARGPAVTLAGDTEKRRRTNERAEHSHLASQRTPAPLHPERYQAAVTKRTTDRRSLGRPFDSCASIAI